MKKQSTGVYLYVPTIFRPEEFPALIGLEDEARYVLHRIIHLHNCYRHDEAEFVTVSRTTWEQFIHATKVTTVLQALLKAKVIKCDGHFIQQKHDPAGMGKSLGYKLCEPYWQDIRRVEVTKRSLAAKIRRHRLTYSNRPIEEDDLRDIDAYLLGWLRKTTIEPEDARQRILEACATSDYQVSSCWMTAEQVIHGDWDYSVCQFGRVHTPITRLLTEARHSLRIDGKPLVNSDVRNSQIVFFVMLMMESIFTDLSSEPFASADPSSYPSTPSYPLNSPSSDSPTGIHSSAVPSCPLPSSTPVTVEREGYGKTQYPKNFKNGGGKEGQKKAGGDDMADGANGLDVPEDVVRFNELVMKGLIYDTLMEQMGWEGGRGEFKGQFFKDVLYGNTGAFWSKPTQLTKLFIQQFPTVWKFINQAKKDNFKDLARQMQVRESRFVMGRVVTRLMNHHPDIPVLTVHDSIMTTPENVPTVRRVFMEEFRRLGVEPSLSG